MRGRWRAALGLLAALGLWWAAAGSGAEAAGGTSSRVAQADSTSILASLESLDKAIWSQTQAEEAARTRLAEITTQLADLQAEGETLNSSLASRRTLLRSRVRALYKYSGRGFASAVLGGGGISPLTRARYLLFIVRRDMALLERHEADLARRDELQRDLVQRQAEAGEAARLAEAERLSLEQERQRRLALLERIRREDTLGARAQAELTRAADQLDVRVLRPATASASAPVEARPPGPSAPAVEATPRPPARPPAAAPTPRPPAATPRPEAVAALDPPRPAPVGPFEATRGRHVYPTTGKITRGYGRYKVEGMLAPAFSKGIEIEAPAGTPFKAVADGTVQMADWFKGYGLMIIINHGDDYRSIYTHAARLLVKPGDKVRAGDVIGLVGDTGSLKGPYLYLEVRQGTTPLNPLEWLLVPPNAMPVE